MSAKKPLVAASNADMFMRPAATPICSAVLMEDLALNLRLEVLIAAAVVLGLTISGTRGSSAVPRNLMSGLFNKALNAACAVSSVMRCHITLCEMNSASLGQRTSLLSLIWLEMTNSCA